MTDLVTAMLARKHRLMHERDKLDYQITSLCTAIDALQLPETTPAHPEVQQPEPATAPPAAFIDLPAQTVAVTELPIPEKAALTPEAPPPQPEATVQQVPPAAPSPHPAWATPARQEVLRKFYPKRTITSREIMGQLAAFDGPSIPDWGNISRYAIDVLGLAATNRSHSPATTKSAAAQPISYHDLMARAAEWGITEINPDALLAAVNAKAVRIGHKPYALQSRSP